MEAFEKAYGYDDDLANDGNWFPIRGINTKLAFMETPAIEAIIKEKREAKIKMLNRNLRDDEHEEIGESIFIEHVLVDWEIENYPCTTENKKAVIKKYPKYVQECIQYANDNNNYKESNISVTVGK